MPENKNIVAFQIVVKGLVQGIGFRPFVFRLAQRFSIHGWVLNTNHAVIIQAQSHPDKIDSFISALKIEKPVASKILEITKTQSIIGKFSDFTIKNSEEVSNEVTYVSPDIAVCDDCLDDMIHQPRRLNYPLVNCCHCGPRFSIVKALPYDRAQTTMKTFEMCSSCLEEYNTILDRRFHAQPISCNHCGPHYTLHSKNISIDNINEIMFQLRTGLESGGIYSFKGTGGFHLVCDALNENTVQKLRTLKHRDTKPFAVMFRNIETLKKYVKVNDIEEQELLSFQRPIVILEEIRPLAASVTLSLGTLGAMLPYMPFHHLFFQNIGLDVLVMTSGNISDEPIIIDNQKALEAFINTTDGVITYNRDIYNRTDDSVISVIQNKPRIIRRSRGFVPTPVSLKINTEGIFATGAELTGTFCFGKDNQAIASQYFGDLQNFENFEFYAESFERFKQLFRFEPTLIATDLHPDYVTIKFANQLGTEIEPIQHHFAHIGSVMAEHNISEPIIGVAFDGTGYGTDGNIWGSEFLICQPTEFTREAHFEYMPLPGGDKVVLEPWRIAVAYLQNTLGSNFNFENIPAFKSLESGKINLILQAIEKQINIPYSCSAGRLFDAVAAITGICMKPSFHAEAPMRLEAAIDKTCDEKYTYNYSNGIISFRSMWSELVEDLAKNISVNTISAKFHNTIVEVIVSTCIDIRKNSGIKKIALSGGSFQNKYLLTKAEFKLNQHSFEVFTNSQFPANDGGIALGQLYITANKRNLKL